MSLVKFPIAADVDRGECEATFTLGAECESTVTLGARVVTAAAT